MSSPGCCCAILHGFATKLDKHAVKVGTRCIVGCRSNVIVSLFVSSSADRHKSFRLRLPSIRREARRNSQPDAENPPLGDDAEESVPLRTLHPALASSAAAAGGSTPGATTPTNQLVPGEKRLLDRELSDVSNMSHLERDSQSSLRRASSLEHVTSSDGMNGRGRLRSTGSGRARHLLLVPTTACNKCELAVS